ncbi:MAG: YaiO family outer membrane beta-barrel protein [Gemmatimonadetes bacterium]|nr:YaiO family outer membrane beta-barrel protein [Gemmatimonadota bacterium]
MAAVRFWSSLALAIWLALAPGALPTSAQGELTGATPDSARAPAGRLELSAYHHSLSAGYGSWRGLDVRARVAGTRVSPWLSGSWQRRREGSQTSFGAGSYLFLSPAVYAIVGASAAPGGTAELFPHLRLDATLLASVPGVPGWVLSAGATDVRFVEASGGSILSLGSILYRGPIVTQAIVRTNRDRESGARSFSAQLVGQGGREGVAWLGGSLGMGNEAYRVVGPTPFDARFQSLTGSIFYTRWIEERRGLTVRTEYEHRLDTYDRVGLSASFFFEI